MINNEIDISQLADEISKCLTEYSVEIGKKIDKVVRITAKKATNELKNASPRRSSEKPRKYVPSGKSYPAGSYAKSWGSILLCDKIGNSSMIARNKTHYRLTHLLENGHKNRNGTNARPIVHITPVEEKVTSDFLKSVEDIINDS